MRGTLVFLMLVSIFYASSTLATEDKLKDTYIEFESAYMSNNADQFSAWLAEDYEIKQTLHIPGVGPDYRPVSKEQLIASMKKTGRPNTLPRSELAAVSIEIISESKFCGSSATITQTKVSGKYYKEEEKRKVCFYLAGGRYIAVEHTIDVYYTKM